MEDVDIDLAKVTFKIKAKNSFGQINTIKKYLRVVGMEDRQYKFNTYETIKNGWMGKWRVLFI
jgi:hypothetical protein